MHNSHNPLPHPPPSYYLLSIFNWCPSFQYLTPLANPAKKILPWGTFGFKFGILFAISKPVYKLLNFTRHVFWLKFFHIHLIRGNTYITLSLFWYFRPPPPTSCHQCVIIARTSPPRLPPIDDVINNQTPKIKKSLKIKQFTLVLHFYLTYLGKYWSKLHKTRQK